MISVGEVKTGNVHTGVEHLDEHVNIPAGWSKGADDLGLTHGKVDLLENVRELDAARVRANVLYWFNHCFLLFVQSFLSSCFRF